MQPVFDQIQDGAPGYAPQVLFHLVAFPQDATIPIRIPCRRCEGGRVIAEVRQSVQCLPQTSVGGRCDSEAGGEVLVRLRRAPPEYLSTHPLTTSRIADIRARADQFPHRDREDSLRFRLVRAKLQVLTSDDPEHTIAHFKAELESEEHESLVAAAYGLGLALSRAGAHDEARELFHRLVQRHPDEFSLRIAAAENALSAGRNPDSIEIYTEAHARRPSNRALVLGLASALLQSRRSDEALATIDAFARSHELDHRMHRLAAEAYAQRGEMTRSRLSLAEHYYLSGQLDAAIYQLQLAAQDAEAGYYLLSRVEARLEELEQELRQRLQSRA